MLNSLVQDVQSITPKPAFKQGMLVIVLFGAIVRLVQYLSNRSLWGDEVMLALNIVDRSYAELLQPLDYNQAAPPGFLWIERFAVERLGNNEYALRLFPFISGLVALGAFYRFADRYGSRLGAVIALTLFACLKHTLYYANEAKQYSSDVMVALLLSLWLIPLHQQPLKAKQLLTLGGIGAIFIWLSHPTVFILAGIEGCHVLIAVYKRQWSLIINRLPMYGSWLLSFIGLYWVTIRGTLENETLTGSWGTRYPNSWLDLSWALDAFGRFFYNPLGFLGWTDGIAIIAFLVGCVALYRRQRQLLLFLTAPMLVTLLASYLEQYPFRERLVLFLAPFAIVIIAEGITWLLTLPRRRGYLSLILGIFLFTTLLVPPVARAAQLVVHPLQVEESRPVIAYVHEHQMAGDRLYVYRSAKEQFIYYAPRFGYAPEDYVLGEQALATGGRRNRELSQGGVKRFRREVRQLRGQGRIWFFFCNALEMEEQAFLAIMEPLGTPLDNVQQPGAFAYLYDLE